MSGTRGRSRACRAEGAARLPGIGGGCEHPRVRLDELPAPCADRLVAAKDPAAWTALCADPRAAAWLAWNVREDAWYGDAELEQIRQKLDAAPAGLTGPALLVRHAGALRNLRQLSAVEQAHLPADGLNHVATRDHRRYELAAASAWAEGSVPGEIADTLLPGDRSQLMPRLPQRSFAWLTFEVHGKAVPRDPDQILRQAGLPWSAAKGSVLRVEVPMGTLRAVGAAFALPTLFDVLDDRPRSHQLPDWRARPESEHQPDEPWGHTRDMQADGPSLPEVIVDITPAGTMNAECTGAPRSDWSARPFLSRSAPR